MRKIDEIVKLQLANGERALDALARLEARRAYELRHRVARNISGNFELAMLRRHRSAIIYI